MRLIAVGKFRAGPELDLFQRYARRLRPTLDLREIPDGHGSAAEIRAREAAALLAGLTASDTPVALDLGGATLASEAFAAMLQTWTDAARPAAFIIGGTEGLAEPVRARAAFVLSLGAMTWPHMLARVMLAEQIFRAQCIASGHPYHRAWRP